jgi:chloride channel 2
VNSAETSHSLRCKVTFWASVVGATSTPTGLKNLPVTPAMSGDVATYNWLHTHTHTHTHAHVQHDIMSHRIHVNTIVYRVKLMKNQYVCSAVYGMVWYGMVWYGMVWYGMVWYVMQCMVCNAVYGMVWYAVYGMVWYAVYGMVWYAVYGMVWYGMVWYGMVWYVHCTCVNAPWSGVINMRLKTTFSMYSTTSASAAGSTAAMPLLA